MRFAVNQRTMKISDRCQHLILADMGHNLWNYHILGNAYPLTSYFGVAWVPSFWPISFQFDYLFWYGKCVTIVVPPQWNVCWFSFTPWKLQFETSVRYIMYLDVSSIKPTVLLFVTSLLFHPTKLAKFIPTPRALKFSTFGLDSQLHLIIPF